MNPTCRAFIQPLVAAALAAASEAFCPSSLTACSNSSLALVTSNSIAARCSAKPFSRPATACELSASSRCLNAFSELHAAALRACFSCSRALSGRCDSLFLCEQPTLSHGHCGAEESNSAPALLFIDIAFHSKNKTGTLLIQTCWGSFC